MPSINIKDYLEPATAISSAFDETVNRVDELEKRTESLEDISSREVPRLDNIINDFYEFRFDEYLYDRKLIFKLKIINAVELIAIAALYIAVYIK